jgi:hypothetical protein
VRVLYGFKFTARVRSCVCFRAPLMLIERQECSVYGCLRFTQYLLLAWHLLSLIIEKVNSRGRANGRACS